jgi:dihydrofolate synthase / folylpolyglutamate synthase
MTPTSTDPEIVMEILAWCQARQPGRAARLTRSRALFPHFADLLPPSIITVAGTAGKGTTCALLSAILREAGYTVGVYTKPHLREFRERILIAGQPVSQAALTRHCQQIWARLKCLVHSHGEVMRPAFYETFLLVGFSLMRTHGVEVAIVEAGIGGANDASSCLPAKLSILTSVGLDHTDQLGDTLEAITRDKAGIARPGSTLILGASLPDDLRKVAMNECVKRGVTPVVAELQDLKVLSHTIHGQVIELASHTVELPFVGEHQAANLATVWQATQELQRLGWKLDLTAIQGVKNARLPGRFEFTSGRPNWLLDVAHNPPSLAALIASANQFFDPAELLVVLGATEPHDSGAFVKLLETWGVKLALCAGFTRAIPTARLAAQAQNRANLFAEYASPADAVTALRTHATGTVIITGSLFLVGECRALLLAPSPLVGEGRGEGFRLHPTVTDHTINCSADPSPQPSPTRGEGAGEAADECITRYLAQPKFGDGIGFSRLRRLWQPDLTSAWGREFTTIRVTGSNGKGSTTAMLHAMLLGLGVKCGRYTSPHLERFHERIVIGERDIMDAELVAADEELQTRFGPANPREAFGSFELITTLALIAFRQAGLRVAVVEAGIGGRYDATRLMPGELVALTSIDLEHTQILGATHELIAYDKLDLTPPGGTVFAWKRDVDLWTRMTAYCDLRQVTLVDCTSVCPLQFVRHEPGGMVLALGTQEFRLLLLGTFQFENLAIAWTLLDHFAAHIPVAERHLKMIAGLQTLHWPGRLECISSTPLVFIDVAHTPDACARLAESICKILPGRKVLVVVGVSADKSLAGNLQPLVSIATEFVATQAHHKGAPSAAIAATLRELAPSLPVTEMPTIEAAVMYARERALAEDYVVLATGGLFVAIEFKAAWQGRDPRALRFY